MKYDLSVELENFEGRPFKVPKIDEDGQQVMDGDKPVLEAWSLKKALEQACAGADPQEFNDLEKKLKVYQLLTKIHKANPVVKLTAEEVTLLKKLVAKGMSVVAMGSICDHLENPLRAVENEVEAG
jgi:hypothetical protein